MEIFLSRSIVLAIKIQNAFIKLIIVLFHKYSELSVRIFLRLLHSRQNCLVVAHVLFAALSQTLDDFVVEESFGIFFYLEHKFQVGQRVQHVLYYEIAFDFV